MNTPHGIPHRGTAVGITITIVSGTSHTWRSSSPESFKGAAIRSTTGFIYYDHADSKALGDDPTFERRSWFADRLGYFVGILLGAAAVLWLFAQGWLHSIPQTGFPNGLFLEHRDRILIPANDSPARAAAHTPSDLPGVRDTNH